MAGERKATALPTDLAAHPTHLVLQDTQGGAAHHSGTMILSRADHQHMSRSGRATVTWNQ